MPQRHLAGYLSECDEQVGAFSLELTRSGVDPHCSLQSTDLVNDLPPCLLAVLHMPSRVSRANSTARCRMIRNAARHRIAQDGIVCNDHL